MDVEHNSEFAAFGISRQTLIRDVDAMAQVIIGHCMYMWIYAFCI